MKHNFCSGPCILPGIVFDQASKSVLELDNIGLSILEISHRSKEFTAIMEETLALTRELLEVPEEYEILYLQGGASMQFAMVPLNLLTPNGTAGFVHTGIWTEAAVKDAARIGNTSIIASSEDRNFTYIPDGIYVPDNLDYLHIATNNTIFGTEWDELPIRSVPLVADMSSNIFSKPFNISDYDLIFAGAQKNLGPAGATLVIIKKDLIGQSGRPLPNMLDYGVHIKKQSAYNTPPVFSIYVCLLTLRWLKAQGGTRAMEKINREKADTLYNELDRNPLIYAPVEARYRSRMNVVFRLHDESRDKELLDFLTARDIVQITGHRLAGGFRASLYNALPLSSVVHLVEALREFETFRG